MVGKSLTERTLAHQHAPTPIHPRADTHPGAWRVRLISRRVREAGDRLTGGGVRALAKRILSAFLRRAVRCPGLIAAGRMLLKPCPPLEKKLQQLSASPGPGSSLPGRLPPLPSENSTDALPLSSSASAIYLKLQAARSNGSAWNRGR